LSVVIVAGIFVLAAASPEPTKADAPIYAWTADNIDVDALAARPKTFPSIYPAIRDEALAAYAKAHPNPSPYDNDARKMIRLLAYLWTWGDSYGEGLWRVGDQAANRARDAGLADPILDFWYDLRVNMDSNSLDGVQFHHRADTFAATGYPEVFKLWYYENTLLKAGQAPAHPDQASMPDLVHRWGDHFATLVQKPLPNQLLYDVGNNALNDLENDPDTAAKLHDEIKQVFAAIAPQSPVVQELEGRYLINEAWQARSSDTADKVSTSQWQQFGDLLAQADTVLEAAYAAHPEEAEISTLMLTVELGQGQGRDRMERWFSRAIQADPLDGEAYSAKFWYLQPRWYGSESDVVAFGRQCLDAPQPLPASLTAFFVGVSDINDEEPDVYTHPEVWVPIDRGYRLFLTQFPQSTRFRTAYARHAAQANRWDIAKEQFALLGDHWDRAMISQADHDLYVAAANSAPKSGAAGDAGPAGGGSTLGSMLWGAWRALTWFF
jgi:hypothetical protein